MNQRWKNWSERFSHRSPREKWLIAACGVIVIGLLMQTLLLDPLLSEQKAARQKLASAMAANQRSQNEIVVIQRQLAKDPNEEINKELAKLLEQSQQLSTQLSQVTSNLVSPSQMVDLLKNVLDHSAKLKLVSLESLPATPVNEKDKNAQYFIHPVRIELTGSYFAIRDYLHALESLKVKYYWRNFQYQVDSYPNARLILEVYTLGTQEDFISG